MELITKIQLPKGLRYVISGGTGAVVNIVTLFVLTHFFDVWYLISSICAFITSFLVSFFLQRTWTFKQAMPHTMTRQMTLYLCVALCNLALNTAIVYGSVEYLKLWYVLAQIGAGILIAIGSFFIYTYLIFI